MLATPNTHEEDPWSRMIVRGSFFGAERLSKNLILKPTPRNSKETEQDLLTHPDCLILADPSNQAFWGLRALGVGFVECRA